MRTFIREKKIFCGKEYLEVDLYPYTKTQAETAKGKRSKLRKVSPSKQTNLNDANAKRRFIQVGNTNFGADDLHVTLTYSKEQLPATIEDAHKEAEKYLRRIKYARAQRGLPSLKYMLVTEYKTAKCGETPVRIHHHIIMNGGLSRDEVENLWRKRRRAGQKQGDKIGYANADRLQPQGNGIAALCTYITKRKTGKKRWSSSQNLNAPDIITKDPGQPPQAVTERKFSVSANLASPKCRTNDHSYSQRELAKIAKNPPAPEYWERRYPGYTLIRDDEYAFKSVFNEHTGKWAVYVKLRRKQVGAKC